MGRLIVDTNVLLDGALDPRGHASQLLAYPRRHSFIVCRWALEEAGTIIAGAPAAEATKDIGMRLVEQFAARLNPLVIDDGGTHLPRNRDEMAKRALTHLGADFVLTRNVKDFPGLNVVTPTELLQEADFASWSIETPWSGFVEKGTVAMRCRCWPGDSFGWLLRTRSEAMVGLSPVDGSIRVRGETRGWRMRAIRGVPHGEDVTIVARIQDGKTVEVSYVDHAIGSEIIQVGLVTTRRPTGWRPVLVYGVDNGWNAEVSWVGCTPRRLTDRQLAVFVSHQTSDRGVDVDTALASLTIL